MNLRRRVAPALLVACAGSAVFAAVERPAIDAVDRPAASSTLGDAAVLLDAARAGRRLVAVGERGLVLLSDDDGKTWRQSPASPTSVTLTAVRFASPTRGWATGHAGLILATDDAGEHWHRQLDGKTFAEASLRQAKAEAGGDAKALADAARLVADGPDKPFLDLWFADDRHGYAIGAYNLFARTDDGGATWIPLGERLPNPKGNHLYAIRGAGDLIMIAGEQGLLLRSTDGGRTFAALASPYAGSFFTLALLPGGELIVGGLRGNAFRSTDRGDSWQAVRGLPPVSLIASIVSADGAVWFGNQAGQVFVSHDEGRYFQPVPAQSGRPSAPLTGLLQIAPDTLLTMTMQGVERVAMPVAAK